MVEPDHAESEENLALDVLGRQAEDAEGDGDVVEDPALGEQPEIAEDHAHRPAQDVDLGGGDAADVHPFDQDAPVGGRALPGHQPEDRRFPRSARPGDEDHLPGRDGEGNVGESPVRFMILLPNVTELDHRGPGRTDYTILTG